MSDKVNLVDTFFSLRMLKLKEVFNYIVNRNISIEVTCHRIVSVK